MLSEPEEDHETDSLPGSLASLTGVAREFTFSDRQKLEFGTTILNVFNQPEFYQFAANANQRYSPNFMTYRSQQPARAVQMLIKYKF